MKKALLFKAWLNPAKCCLLFIFLMVLSLGCRKANFDKNDLRDFQQVTLVANNAGYSPQLTDPTLQNAWGLAWAPVGIAWVNSMAGHVSELYTAEGAIVRPPVNIPSPTDTIGGFPTGIVFAGGAGFKLANNLPPNFLFAGIDGVLSGWNGGNNAQRIANNSSTSAYTGLALATKNGSHFLYAANFRTGKIDVWDTTFTAVTMPFLDAGLPQGYSPFNIQSVGPWLFVEYAKIGTDGRDQAGAGLGFVNVFNTGGVLIRRFASKGTLNAPWGVVLTPANFLDNNDMQDNDHGNNKGGHDGSGGNNSGPGSGNSGSGNSNNGSGNNNSGPGNNNNGRNDIRQRPVILVGNFGDGRINVFSLEGEFLGQLQSHNRTIVIDRLWALAFAPTTATMVDPERLYFTAGPNNETDGIFGYLIKK